MVKVGHAGIANSISTDKERKPSFTQLDVIITKAVILIGHNIWIQLPVKMSTVCIVDTQRSLGYEFCNINVFK